MALLVQHEFVNVEEEKSATDSFTQEAIIVVGTTGTGKSSLIKLYCGNNVIVGHGVKSETQGSALFRELTGGRFWLDSQGANDSKGVNDEKVLKDVLKELYINNIGEIRIIWCVSGDFDREKWEFSTQAKFIKSLGQNAWQSCLIIEKKGPVEPDSLDGVLEAAKNQGANIEHGDKRLFGYTGFEFKSNDTDKKPKKRDNALDLILKYTKPGTKEREQELLERGYLTNEQIVQFVNERLSELPANKISFEICTCNKCDAKGDPRFVYAPCHPKLEQYHPELTISYHENNLAKFHTGGLLNYHSGGIHTDITTEKYHRGEWKNFGSSRRGKWTCCKQKGTDDTREEGCSERVKVGSSSWTCCGWSSGAEGCKQKYGCCGGSKDSDGCREEWSCCGASKGSAGCRRKYKCCDEDEGKSDGCSNRCQSCHQALKSKGCSLPNTEPIIEKS